MIPILTDTLCTRCALCCDGTLFADVELVGRAEATRLEIMGLEVEDDASDAGLLSQPCAALQGKRCGIYAHRPNCCRVFRCKLLQDAELGEVTVERAIELIGEAQTRIGRVKGLLIEMGQVDTRLPLKERCAEALAGEPGNAPEAGAKRAELKALMAGLEGLIWHHFLGSGKRKSRDHTPPQRGVTLSSRPFSSSVSR